MSDSMSFDPPMPPRTPAVPSRSYVMAWVTVALLAVGYVSALAARPEFLTAILPEVRADGAGGSDVATMRSTIQQLNSELAEAKTAAATSSAQVSALTARISELEGKLAAASQPTPAAPVAMAPVEAPASALARKFAEAKAAAPEPVKPQVVAKAAVPPSPPAAAEAPAVSQIETGSLALPKSAAATPPPAATPVAFGTAVVTPAPQPFGLQIGRGGSIDELRLSWNLLQETHAASLKTLSPHYAAASDAADAPLNLLAGPIKSKAEAIKTCKALSAQGVACKVGAFAGEPL